MRNKEENQFSQSAISTIESFRMQINFEFEGREILLQRRRKPTQLSALGNEMPKLRTKIDEKNQESSFYAFNGRTLLNDYGSVRCTTVKPGFTTVTIVLSEMSCLRHI